MSVNPPTSDLRHAVRPVRCSFCNQEMFYAGDSRHEAEVRVVVYDNQNRLAELYSHARCWSARLRCMKALQDTDPTGWAHEPEILAHETCDGCGNENTYVQVVRWPSKVICLCRGCLESSRRMLRVKTVQLQPKSMNEETKLPTTQTVEIQQDKGRCAPAPCSAHVWVEQTLREPNFHVAFGAVRTCARCGKQQTADYTAGRIGGPWVDSPNAPDQRPGEQPKP